MRNPDTPIDISNRDEMVLMVSAMSKIENGLPADIDDVLAGWNLYQQDRN